MKGRISIELALIGIAAFLCPLIGGQVPTDPQPLVAGQLLSAIFGGSETPLFSHFMIALPLCGAMILVCLSRRILQFPSMRITIPLLGFLTVLLASIGSSAFKGASVTSFVQYALCISAIFAGPLCVGRTVGPRVVLGSLFAGCIVEAVIGVIQYGSMRTIDPTWRIFGTFVNPNALAAMLLVGLLVGIGLLISSSGQRALLIGAGCFIIGLAMMLTQSKGGYLAAGFGIFIFFATYFLAKKQGEKLALNGLRNAIALFVCLLGAFMMLRFAPSPGTNQGAMSRIIAASSTQDQSAVFRKLLWKTSMELVRLKPAGYGVGTFRFESARPGLTTQTVFAHNSYLQLAAEASPLAPILLLTVIVIWFFEILKTARKLPPETATVRAGIIAAVAAICVHSLVDSDFSYAGVATAFFLLLGVGLQLSVDGASPEFCQFSLRSLCAFGATFCLGMLAYMGLIELKKDVLEESLIRRDLNAAQQTLQSLQSLAPFDGDVWREAARISQTPPGSQERIDFMKRAVESTPTTKMQRALAHELTSAEKYSDAILAYQSALRIDPNNLLSLKALMSVYQQNQDITGAVSTARRLMEVEKKPYYQVRALPQIVPTETFEARMFLAVQSVDPVERANLLRPAVEGYMRYCDTTLPELIRNASGTPTQDFAGENFDTAAEKITKGRESAEFLLKTYRALGDTAGADWASASVESFGVAAGKLPLK